MAAAPQAARRPRIVNPVNGSVYAIDPDIPADRQRLAVTVSGAVAGHRLILDKRPAGDADAGLQIVPRPGSHVLALVDPGATRVDDFLHLQYLEQVITDSTFTTRERQIGRVSRGERGV